VSILDRDVLQAFCRHTHVERGPTASGPLDGLTFGLKDIFDVAGHRTGFGSPDWLRTHPPAEADATVLARLLAAGATMVGRTHTEEMAFSLTGENAHYGTPVNPAAPGHVPGGSSSGSAAAVAGGLVDFAIGTDTGGSVRAPASFCGIFGLRPTHGRVPLDGCCPLAPIFDTCGWFARDAVLLARVADVLLDTRVPATPPPRRLLIAVDAFALVPPDTRAALAPAVAAVEGIVGAAAPVTLAPDGLPAWFEVFRVLQYADIWAAHGAWVTHERPRFGPQIAARFAAVAQVERDDVARRHGQRVSIRAQLDALLADDTVLLMPTAPDVAPRLALPPEETVRFREQALTLLCVAGLGELPQLSLPIATLGGLPLGLSLVAGRGQDELLLATACELAQHLPARR
jgi:amidase